MPIQESIQRSIWLVFISVIFLVSNSYGQDQQHTAVTNSPKNRLTVLTSVDDVNKESFIRFNRSISAFDLKLELIRLDSPSARSWNDWTSTPTTATSEDNTLKTQVKLKNLKYFELLRKSLAQFKSELDLVILLVDSSHSIVNGYEHEILTIFNQFTRTNNTRILFSADSTCWPDSSLAKQFPHPLDGQIDNDISSSSDVTVKKQQQQKRFLNSKLVIGYASALWDLLELTAASVKESDTSERLLIEALDYDFQLYSTRVFVNSHQRHRLQLEIDYRSSLFENLSGEDEIELDFGITDATAAAAVDRVELKNLIHNTRPLVVHGSGAAKIVELNSFGNYLGKAWTPRDGCRHCNATRISLASIKDSDLPRVLIGVFIEEATPFMENFFKLMRELNYPKSQVHLFLHLAVDYHAHHVSEFLQIYGPLYASHELATNQSLNEAQARDYALHKCKQVGCDYYLALDSLARLEEPETLRELIETNRTIVAPLLSRPGKLWSNFWGALTSDGYYERSHDYLDLVTRERQGLWNVPLLMNAYLIEGKFLRHTLEQSATTLNDNNNNNNNKLLTYLDAKFPEIKPVLIFGRNLRLLSAASQGQVFQYVTNRLEFGHLIDPTHYNTSRLFPEFYELINNKHDWEREYLHENFSDLFDERDEDERNYPNRIRLEQPCPDVYWFPVVSDRFCDQLIALMEQFGQWSSGQTHDPRIEGGYESVPTRDIHFKQVGLHEMWLFFLREYIMPVQLKEFIGYEHDPPRTDLAFVVRYHPSEQPSLRPHHDSSTYTLNVALNTPGLDYSGGGCRFVRYNCSVTESRRGWALIHPGRLTHYHEGLPVTNGTRYILVTFVDP